MKEHRDHHSTLRSVRPVFRVLATSILPETASLDPEGWSRLEGTVEGALQSRPAKMRRQLTLLIHVLNWLPLMLHARSFRRLGKSLRVRFLQRIQDSPVLLLRRGFWGLRTLVFLGYYGQGDVAAKIGYRADPRGWEVRR